MDRLPPKTLLNTFLAAVLLKLVAVVAAVVLSRYLIGDWVVNRWWMSLLTGTLLLIVLLLPWPRLLSPNSRHLPHFQLILALAFAIISPFADVIQTAYEPAEQLFGNERFMREFGWTLAETNDIHALGFLFVMVPVVLASWQYGRWGMLAAQGSAGLLYAITPLMLPPDAFDWFSYWVRGFVLLGVTLILAFTTYFLAASMRREQAALAAANAQLAAQAETMEQLATSRERNRLARELHDTLAHALSGTAVQLQAVGTLLNVNPEAARTELKSAQRQIRQGLEESRRAIAALRATPLEEAGLAGALQQRGQALAERLGIHIQCDLDTPPNSLTPTAAQALYRIADEALLNSEKYAEASRIHIDLRTDGDEVVLTVWDDGIGFDVAAVQRQNDGSHFGLFGMAERAELIGAELIILSQPEEGTQVEVRLKTRKADDSRVDL